MAQYIDKDVLVSEIKSSINDIKISQKAGFIKKRDANKRIIFFESILSFIDTLEVKVEREFSLEDYMSFFEKHPNLSDDWGFDEACIFAKYFFELGQKGE